jgi:TonB-dependent SusC/RagA subfamily outer membrane receptor
MKKHLLLFSLAVALFSSCISQKSNARRESNATPKEISDGYNTTGTRNYTGSADEVKNLGLNVPLDVYMRGLAGVGVEGSGANAKITVRGVNSFVSNPEPLFVVNNNALNGGFSSAFQMIQVNDIKSVTVLKDAGSTSIYGVRGANGVIVITLKK